MIETDQAKITFSTGLSSGAILPFSLRFFEKDDLQVWVTSGGVATLLSPTVEYSIADSSSYAHGADVTLLTSVPDGAVVTVKRVLPVTQGLELPNHGKLPTESLEAQLDHVVMVQQQQAEELERAFKVPIGGSATVIPGQTDYAHYAEYAGYANAAGSAGRAGVAEAIEGGVVVNSAGHATKAGGLDTGVVVDSAGHATKAGGLDQGVVVASATHATAAAGLDAGVVVDSATNATSASKLGGATKAQILASASSSTVSSASSCTYLGGATKQQVINSAVQSAGGGGGGMVIPDYPSIDYNNPYAPKLSAGSTYVADGTGWLRISLHNFGATYGCFGVYIGGASIGLYQFSNSAGPGMTWMLPVSSGMSFCVNSPPTSASVLVMFDKSTRTPDDD